MQCTSAQVHQCSQFMAGHWPIHSLIGQGVRGPVVILGSLTLFLEGTFLKDSLASLLDVISPVSWRDGGPWGPLLCKCSWAHCILCKRINLDRLHQGSCKRITFDQLHYNIRVLYKKINFDQLHYGFSVYLIHFHIVHMVKPYW